MDSLLPMGGQMFSSRWTGPHHLQWWLGKTNSITPNIHPSSFSARLYTENDATSGIYLWSVWVAYPRCVSSPLPMHPNVLPTMAIQKAEKALSLRNPCSAYTKASLYYQPWVPPKIQSHTNHSDKIVPAKTSTLAYILSPGFSASPSNLIANLSYLVLTFDLYLIKAFWIFLHILKYFYVVVMARLYY